METDSDDGHLTMRAHFKRVVDENTKLLAQEKINEYKLTNMKEDYNACTQELNMTKLQLRKSKATHKELNMKLD